MAKGSRDSATDASSDAAAEAVHENGVLLLRGLADELERPLRELRQMLALMVDKLDHHVAEASGPTPLPWSATKGMREDLADAYLTCRTLTRVAGDLALALRSGGAASQVDVNGLVESSVNLTRHRLASTSELFVDRASVALPVKAVPGVLLSVMSRLLLLCATSAARADRAAVSIRTRKLGEGDDAEAAIYISDNGAGAEAELASAQDNIAPLVERFGGTFAGTSQAGAGSTFELHFPLTR